MNVSDIQDIGHYRVKRFIAEGGMAWVFEVVDTRYEGFEVVRALKMLKPDFAMGDEFERFKTEASVLAGIDHPNLVTIYDPPDRKDEATGCFYYTMAFIEGPTLATYQSQRGELTELETLQIFEELISGLAELHRRKIVHRDIKPANVLIGTDGRPRLADLGIARLQETTSRTKTGFALGTVNYMSPEQARGKSVAEPSDVFAIGITLYEALTGRHVYDDMDDVDSTNSHDVLGYLAAMARSGTEIEATKTRARCSRRFGRGAGRVRWGPPPARARACSGSPAARCWPCWWRPASAGSSSISVRRSACAGSSTRRAPSRPGSSPSSSAARISTPSRRRISPRRCGPRAPRASAI
jgi:serine/threonine protein kinase